MRRVWRVGIVVLVAALGFPLATPPAGAVPTAVPVVTGLAYPAMFTVAPDGRIFYSELSTGRIGVFDQSTGAGSTYFLVTDVCTGGDKGLYGLALHPDYPAVPSLYAFATRRAADGSCHNQVLRIDGSTADGRTAAVLLDDPYVAGHNGGRLLFGPDRNLYVSTGDGSSTLPTPEQEKAQRAVAQDVTSVKGKVLRMTASGGVPGDNPFGNVVYAYGFRNVFGFDFDPSTGQLWATDNGPDPSFLGDPRGPGPSGGCNDEVNRVVRGANYGWGPAGTCGEPPPTPVNSNQDGASPVLPARNIAAASGITGARFCSGCGLGPEYEGRLLYVDYDYRSGEGAIRAATLSADRTAVTGDSDPVVYQPTGRSPLSLERGPDGTIYYSDNGGIHKLAGPGAPPGPGPGAHITLTAAAHPTSGPEPLTVTYTYTLVNDGADVLFHASVSDDGCSPVVLQSGDVDGDQLLDPSETWTLRCSRTLGAGTYTSTVTAVAKSTQTGLAVSSNTAQVTVSVDGATSTTVASTSTTVASTNTTTVPGSSGAPTNLTLTSRTASTAGISWNPVTGASEYRAYVSRTAGSGYFLWASGFTGNSATLYSLTGDFYVVVRAVVGGVESASSNEVLAPGDGSVTTTTTTTTVVPTPTTTTTAPGSSGAPTNLTLTSRTASTAGIGWNPVTGASEYRAYVSRTAGSGYFLWASGFTDNSATLYSLTGDFYVVVRAVVGGAESASSNEVLAAAP